MIGAQTHSSAFSSLLPAIYPASTVSLIAEYADQAVLTELMLTPKPGLVDRRNCGAHRDMDMQTFLASARAIAPWWPCFVEIGFASAHIPACDFLPLARPAGVLCEKAMLQATRGVNTHKGAIFSLGLLCSAAGRLLARRIEAGEISPQRTLTAQSIFSVIPANTGMTALFTGLNREEICSEVAKICVGLVDRELDCIEAPNTAGERIFTAYGLAGARGEAASGYALVRTLALPIYDRLRIRGIGEDVALLQVLLHLLAANGDTNLVSRGGPAGLNYVREYAANLLSEGGALARDGLKKMEAFDDALIARHLSPGGSADLLGVSWFLAQFPHITSGIEADRATEREFFPGAPALSSSRFGRAHKQPCVRLAG